MIAEVKRLIESADPSVLLMSRRNCHAVGVDSFVLLKEGRCLTRFFAAWAGHPLGANFPGSAAYSVGPHNHRYGLTLSPIGGKIVNYEFEAHPDGMFAVVVLDFGKLVTVSGAGMVRVIDCLAAVWSPDSLPKNCPVAAVDPQAACVWADWYTERGAVLLVDPMRPIEPLARALAKRFPENTL